MFFGKSKSDVEACLTERGYQVPDMFDLQSARGFERNRAWRTWRPRSGFAPDRAAFRVQPLDELPAPEMQAMISHRAVTGSAPWKQTPRLLQQLEGVKAAEGTVREARAAYYGCR